MVSPCLAGASNGSRGTEGAKAADISKPWYLSIAGSSECLSKIWYLGFDPSVYKRRDDNLSACFFFKYFMLIQWCCQRRATQEVRASYLECQEDISDLKAYLETRIGDGILALC